MEALRRMPSWTSCQTGSTSARFENRTVALPWPFSIQALAMTPITSSTVKSRCELSSGAAPLAKRPMRIAPGSIENRIS
jgi:hypothetical protein